jgi:hypothetical protein
MSITEFHAANAGMQRSRIPVTAGHAGFIIAIDTGFCTRATTFRPFHDFVFATRD